MTEWRLQPRHDRIAVGLLGLLLFLPGLGSRDLWNPDEPRYAEVAREMRASGEYLVPHLNGSVYEQKPPLQFWAIAMAATATGSLDESAVRLPAALAATGTLLLVFALGLRLFSRRAAWLSVAVLATSVKFFWQGRLGQIDMLLVFLVTLAVWCWAKGHHEDRAAFSWLFFLVAGLATLAKGPVGLLPPLLSIVAFLCWQRDWRGLRRLRVGSGLLIWAAVAAAWLLPAAARAGGDYLANVTVRQNLTRYADPWHHVRPWYYYLTVLPGDFFPWSFLLPTAGVVGFRDLGERQRGAFRFVTCWVVVTLLFFNLSPAKRTVYVLTMYPGMALAVGAALDRLASAWPRRRHWLLVPAGLVAGLTTLIALAAGPVLSRRPEAALFPAWTPEAIAILLAIAAAGGWAAWLLARRGRPVAGVAALAAGTAVACLGLVLVVLPLLDRVKSAKRLSAVLLERAAPTEPYAVWPRLDAAFIFYTERFAVPLRSEEELFRYATAPGRKWLLIQRDDLGKLDRELPLVAVAADRDLRKGYLLMTDPTEPERMPTGSERDPS